MNKRMEITISDTSSGGSSIFDADTGRYERVSYTSSLRENEYPNLYLKNRITNEELEHALDIIVTYFMQQHKETIIMNLDMMDDARKPVKEMSIKEIEEKLGYKIKIVN